MIDMTTKNWTSLSQVRDYLIQKKQKIVSFDGIFLETSKERYSLGSDGLTIMKKGGK